MVDGVGLVVKKKTSIPDPSLSHPPPPNNQTHVVRQVSVHDHHKVAAGQFQARRVRGAEAQLAGARLQNDPVAAVRVHQGAHHVGGAVGGGVVDDDDFKVEVAELGKRW